MSRCLYYSVIKHIGGIALYMLYKFTTFSLTYYGLGLIGLQGSSRTSVNAEEPHSVMVVNGVVPSAVET